MGPRSGRRARDPRMDDSTTKHHWDVDDNDDGTTPSLERTGHAGMSYCAVSGLTKNIVVELRQMKNQIKFGLSQNRHDCFVDCLSFSSIYTLFIKFYLFPCSISLTDCINSDTAFSTRSGSDCRVLPFQAGIKLSCNKKRCRKFACRCC